MDGYFGHLAEEIRARDKNSSTYTRGLQDEQQKNIETSIEPMWPIFNLKQASNLFLSTQERNVKETWKEPACHSKRESLFKSSTHSYLVVSNEMFKKLPEKNIRNSKNYNMSTCTMNAM